MPILATGNKRPAPRRDAGFSLVELLAVLAILSLMVGAVVLNLPEPRSEADRASEQMAAQLSAFLDQGAVRGEMRAIGADTDGLVLFRHNGLTWDREITLSWPEQTRPRLEQGDEMVELTERVEPLLLFEPYGAVPDFTLTLRAPEAQYRLTMNDRGEIERVVDR